MILVDTSVWIEHFRSRGSPLAELLASEWILVHPFVVGEFACGSPRNRAETLALLRSMPVATVATDDEVMHLIESRRLMGKGIGYVDAHLLAAAIIDGAQIWTLDAALHRLAVQLGAAKPGPLAFRH